MVLLTTRASLILSLLSLLGVPWSHWPQRTMQAPQVPIRYASCCFATIPSEARTHVLSWTVLSNCYLVYLQSPFFFPELVLKLIQWRIWQDRRPLASPGTSDAIDKDAGYCPGCPILCHLILSSQGRSEVSTASCCSHDASSSFRARQAYAAPFQPHGEVPLRLVSNRGGSHGRSS